MFLGVLNSFLWSWRGSNPRPNKEPIGFLHAYPSLIFVPEQEEGNQPEPYPLNFTTGIGEHPVAIPFGLKPRFGAPTGETLRETTRSNALGTRIKPEVPGTY